MTEGLPVRTFKRLLRFSRRRPGDAGRCLFLVDYTSKLVRSLRRQTLGEAYEEVAVPPAIGPAARRILRADTIVFSFLEPDGAPAHPAAPAGVRDRAKNSAVSARMVRSSSAQKSDLSAIRCLVPDHHRALADVRRRIPIGSGGETGEVEVQAGAACAFRSSPRHAGEQFPRRAGLKEAVATSSSAISDRSTGGGADGRA